MIDECRKAHLMVTFFEEKQPGVRTYWHDLYDRLKLAIAGYNKIDESLDEDREVIDG